MPERRTIAYLGNFSVDFSTESHVAKSLESLGHSVLRIQEGETPATSIAKIVDYNHADVFLWTQTFGLAETGGTRDERAQMLDDIRSSGIPSVAYHLDLWWGLGREPQLYEEPYFRCDHVFTTDNCIDKWAALGVNHHYLPPAVYHAEAYDGTPRREFKSDVAFVGSWRHYGHEEHWPVRKAMLDTLRRKYGRRFRCWPIRQAIRGTDLTDLYASVKVVVGDSCLAGKVPGYWSDRVPETMGRGGFLIHPYVDGLQDTHAGVICYAPGDWSTIIDFIDFYLSHDDSREDMRRLGAADTREIHTYRNRMATVLETVLGG